MATDPHCGRRGCPMMAVGTDINLFGGLKHEELTETNAKAMVFGEVDGL